MGKKEGGRWEGRRLGSDRRVKSGWKGETREKAYRAAEGVYL